MDGAILELRDYYLHERAKGADMLLYSTPDKKDLVGRIGLKGLKGQ